MSEMVERVALALYAFEADSSEFSCPVGPDAWPTIMGERGKNFWRQLARAAITAMREPTADMLWGGATQTSDGRSYVVPVIEIYPKMIDAALQSASSQSPPLEKA